MTRCYGIAPSDEIEALNQLLRLGDQGLRTSDVAVLLFPDSRPGYERMVHQHALETLKRLEQAGLARRRGRRWVAA